MGFIVRICGLVIAISAITIGNYIKKKIKWITFQYGAL